MNDTVKLIIEIPKEVKQVFDNAESNNLKGGFYDYGGIIGRAIQNGIPYDDVKAEIKTFTITEKSEYDIGFNDAVLKCFNILDNIGKESEVKPNE